MNRTLAFIELFKVISPIIVFLYTDIKRCTACHCPKKRRFIAMN